MVSAAWRTRSPTSAALSDSSSSSRADWSRAIAWHLSTSCLAVTRRGSRGGLFVLVRHAEEEAGSYTTQRDVTFGSAQLGSAGPDLAQPSSAWLAWASLLWPAQAGLARLGPARLPRPG